MLGHLIVQLNKCIILKKWVKSQFTLLNYSNVFNFFLSLVSKQSTYAHVNYHQSSFHFIKKFFRQSNFHLIRKNYLYQSNFYFTIEIFFINGTFLSNDIFSWIQLLIMETIIFINPASIEWKT